MSGLVRKLVAVVDDDPRLLESFEDLLESAGHEVRLHSSVSSLLEGGVSNIDCLITDIAMPVMDGFELRDRVRLVRPDLPLFLISGQRELIERSLTSVEAMTRFLSKPFDGSALLAAMDAALPGSATDSRVADA